MWEIADKMTNHPRIQKPACCDAARQSRNNGRISKSGIRINSCGCRWARAFVIWLFVIPWVFGCLGISTFAAPRPNIILIFCDDLGYADVGFNAKLYGVETDVVTPNLDSLAGAGTLFRQAYVAHPFCGPSRMALLSGRMPHTFGGQKNLPDHAKNLEDYNQRGIPTGETLLSAVLQRAGYATACIGKWHLGFSRPCHPNRRGFDLFYGFLGGGHQYYPYLTDKVEPKINDYQYFLERNGQNVRSPEGAYLTDTLSDETVRFIRSTATKNKEQRTKNPFFIYLAYNAPHSPLQGKTEDLKHLYPDHQPANPRNGVNWTDYDKRQNYAAMVHAVDRGVGRILKTLKDPDNDGDASDSIEKETLIVFLSDNGGKILQAANNAPLLDDKGSTHEGGIRVPMFMHWPGETPAGKVFDHPVSALDLYPTFAGLAGAKIPTAKKLDGRDIWKDIVAGANPRPDAPMFWLRHHGGGNEVAIRRGDLKAYRKMFGAWQVFNVAKDPGETTDIAKQSTRRLDAMVDAGLEWSGTLMDPQWHDTRQGLITWRERDMPQYPRTFQRR